MSETASMAFSHDGWDAYYRAHQGERAWNGVPDEFLMEHLDEVIPAGATSVIDVAAGDGRNSEPFLERDMSVFAADLSPAALTTFGERCREHGYRAPTMIAGDFISLGLVPNQFDCAVCFNSIPHFESPELALKTIVDVLRPGGRAAFNAFTPGDVAFGQGEKIGPNKFYYQDTLFLFMTEDEVSRIIPYSARILRSETRRWDEPDHGTYRRGTHTHEASFFLIEKREAGRA